MELTSKQRAYLKGLAMNIDPIFNIGKSSLTPEFTESINETFNNKELIKISVLKNCIDDPKEIARALAERTKPTIAQGRAKIETIKPIQPGRNIDKTPHAKETMPRVKPAFALPIPIPPIKFIK